MEVVAPASLQSAHDAATATDRTFALVGDLRGDVKITKPGLMFIRKDGAQASYTGRLWASKTAADCIWQDVKINGRNSQNYPSPTIDAPRFRLLGRPSVGGLLEITNDNTCIGLSTTKYDGAAPDDFLGEYLWIHHCGKLFPGRQEELGNHDHGAYFAAGRRGRLRHSLLHDNADRALQVYSYATAHDWLVEHNIAAFNGEGFLVGGGEAGETAARTVFRRNIGAYTQTKRGAFEEWFNDGVPEPSNVFDENVRWTPGSVPPNRLDDLAAADSRWLVADPKFVNVAARIADPSVRLSPADFVLTANSPALGYGPSWAQPGGPVPADRAAILADARAHMKLTTITYKTWLARKASGYYSNPAATEWAKTDARLDQLK